MAAVPVLECQGVNYIHRDSKAASVHGGRGVASGEGREPATWDHHGAKEDAEDVETLPREWANVILSGHRTVRCG